MGYFNDRWWFWSSVLTDCDDAVGLKVLPGCDGRAVWGHWWGGGGRCFSSRSLRRRARQTYGPLTGCWGESAVLTDGGRDEWQQQCEAPVSTYWANTLKIRAMPLEIWRKKKSNQSLEVDFSYRVRLPLFSTPRPDPMLSSKYLWRSCKFEQIYNVVTRPLFFCSKTRGLFRWSENK